MADSGWGIVKYDEVLAKHTSLKIGGPAKIFVELDSLSNLPQIIEYSHTERLPIVVIGNGSNVLFSDSGFEGIVVKLPSGQIEDLKDSEATSRTLIVPAGLVLGKLLSYCRQNNLGGLEFLTGIPGTMGGAVVTNAGAHGAEICEYITKVEVLNSKTGETSFLNNSDCSFKYRESIFANLNADLIICRVFLRLDGMNFDSAKQQQILSWRASAQPINLPNAGSIFKNPEGDYAGRLIEVYLGKGYRIGQAAISNEHANIFVNLGGASSADFQELIAHTKKVVYDKSNVLLEEEIIIYK